MTRIHFDELLKNYQFDLLNNLRGFGEQLKFLNYWVPGSEKIDSLNNLVEALYEVKIFQFIVILNSKDNYLAEKIMNLDQKIGKVSISNKNNIELHFELNETDYVNFLKKKINRNYKQKKKIFSQVNEINRKSKDYILHDDFRSEIKKLNVTKFKKLYDGHKSNFKYYEGKILDGNISLFINPENGIITKSYHNLKKINNESILVDIFLEQISLQHIQEAAEHSIIFLEHSLRARNFTEKIKGIVLPYHGGKLFDELNVLINKIYQEFKKDTDFKEKINKNYLEISTRWKKLSKQQKIKEINNTLLNIINPKLKLDENDIFLTNIELNFRVIVQLSDNFKKRLEKENVLLEAESMLKLKLEKRLELFNLEVKDQNKLRLKNSPQKDL